MSALDNLLIDYSLEHPAKKELQGLRNRIKYLESRRYPTQRQILAWFYRYVYEYSPDQTAKIMGIDRRNVSGLIARFKKIWPNLIPKPREKDPSFCQFNEEMHSQEHQF